MSEGGGGDVGALGKDAEGDATPLDGGGLAPVQTRLCHTALAS